jgi:hypothetical protein
MKILLLLFFPITLLSQINIDKIEIPELKNKDTFINCEELQKKTPPFFYFEIFGDTLINLNNIDSRLNSKLHFNWNIEKESEWDLPIAVEKIEILIRDKVIQTINLKNILKVEAFRSKKNYKLVRDDIQMIDINMDTYLDLVFKTDCGKACYYSYWIYDVKSNKYIEEKSLDSFRPYHFDCKRRLVFSYDGGDYNEVRFSVYKITTNGTIEFLKTEVF